MPGWRLSAYDITEGTSINMHIRMRAGAGKGNNDNEDNGPTKKKTTKNRDMIFTQATLSGKVVSKFGDPITITKKNGWCLGDLKRELSKRTKIPVESLHLYYENRHSDYVQMQGDKTPMTSYTSHAKWGCIFLDSRTSDIPDIHVLDGCVREPMTWPDHCYQGTWGIS